MEDRTSFTTFSKAISAACLATALALASPVAGQTIYEVWSPNLDQQAMDGTFGTGNFRKKLTLVDPQEAEILLSAKDDFEIYVNEQPVAAGQSSGTVIKYDIAPMVRPGINLIAIRVRHRDSVTAGLAAKFRVREQGEERWRSLTTDDSWRSFSGQLTNWSALNLDDRHWEKSNKLNAVKFDPAEVQTAQTSPITGAAPGMDSTNEESPAVVSGNRLPESPPATPSKREQKVQAVSTTAAKNAINGIQPQTVSARSTTKPARFKIDSEFEVQQVMSDGETGSVIAMAFNEFGQLILSQEGGPLMLADVTRPPGSAGRIRVLCPQVNSCQGILPLNGSVFVTAAGPSGTGLYCLKDKNRDGIFEVDRLLIPFAGQLSEHGPHGIELGPDGMLYVVIGNSSNAGQSAALTSPYLHTYEGDLVPRMEDPGGHAVGIKAPGGTVIRTSLDGSIVETVSGGLRNVYDLAFNEYGELFLHDSDLETNMGMSWYRPTRLYHVPPGAELGWRSGWSKFPDYFPDVTPPIQKTGRGSPSGAVYYRHFQFPARYQDSLFLADWSEGRILNVRLEPDGAGYKVDSEVFVSGRPMNVTDLAVAMDGSLFFCTGGRGTGGGVYRVSWKGQVPEEFYTYNNDYEKIIRAPQPNSAWSRQATAMLKKELGEHWAPTLNGIAIDQRNDIHYRLRALEVLFFYGPFPNQEVIQQLTEDEDYRMRACIARLCGFQNQPENQQQLEKLIADSHPLVRRTAAESYLRIDQLPPLSRIMAMFTSNDRTEATVARRLLERVSADSYLADILSTEDLNVFVQGSIALLTASPTEESACQIIDRVAHFMEGFINDVQFANLLRVAQMAMFRGNVNPDQIPDFAARIVDEFPAGNGMLNKQLAMIMAYLKQANVSDRIEQYFTASDNSDEDKIFVAMQLQTIGSGLDDSCRFAVLDYLETAVQRREGTTYRNYISTAIKDLAKTCSTADQINRILQNGDRWPNAMLQSFFNLNGRLTTEQVAWVIAADRGMHNGNDALTRRIRTGCIAMLAESGNADAFDYLRDIWRTRPDYRNEITLGLAQQPSGENWPYLVTSFRILDDSTGKEVADALLTVNRRPKQPQQYRELIELGYQLRENGADVAAKLMQHWTNGQTEPEQPSQLSWRESMDYWSDWYQQEWPNELPIRLPSLPKVGLYTAEQVLSHLEQSQNLGQVSVGKQVFRKANCSACHRLGDDGATFGPDLTNLANRFTRREILESIIHPSQVVSDQYRSRKVLTVDGEQLFGMVSRDSSGEWLLLDREGRTTRIPEDDIEDMADSDLSSMPDGLLDSLSLDEITHLFAYLMEQDNLSTAESSFQPAQVR